MSRAKQSPSMAIDLFDLWKFSLNYLKKIFFRITDKNYPSNYTIVFENNGTLEIARVKNDRSLKREAFSLTDALWKDYLKNHRDLPVYAVVSGADIGLRVLPTEKLKFFERRLMVRQIRDNEFDSADLVGGYTAKSGGEKSYVLVSVSDNDTLAEFFRELATLPVILAGVSSFELEMAKKTPSALSPDHELRDWVIHVIDRAEKEFTLIAFYQDRLILQRHVYCAASEIDEEIGATLKFLKRSGYENDMPVSVSVPERVFETISGERRLAEFLPIKPEFFAKENYNPREPFLKFAPKCLAESRYGYAIPAIFAKCFFPLVLIPPILGMAIRAESFFRDYGNGAVLKKRDELLGELPKDIDKKLRQYERLKLYAAAMADNPSALIRELDKKLSRAKLHAHKVVWRANAGNETNEKAKFELKLFFAEKHGDKLRKFQKKIEKTLGKVAINLEGDSKESVLSITGNNPNEN